MEENVALDTSKQKKFVKSIKGIKKLIKKAEEGVPIVAAPKEQGDVKPKKKRPDRGLVYLSHIPHGFYEHEMSQYFGQFGQVTNVRVIRSKKTGNSKGFAFVEFKQPEVAEIVAETMNNYLMGKRLIKASCIPPEKQKLKAKRKHWSVLNNPTVNTRIKQNKAYNANKDKAGDLAKARKTYANYKKNMKKLSDIGINYDFFTPVDIPKDLNEKTNASEAKDSTKTNQSKDRKTKKETKQLKKDKLEEKTNSKQDKKTKQTQDVTATEKSTKKDSKKNDTNKLAISKAKNTKVAEPIVVDLNKNHQENKKKKSAAKEKAAEPNVVDLNKNQQENKKNKKAAKEKVSSTIAVQEKVLKGKKASEPVNKAEQKQKQLKLKNAGVKLPENFIKIQDEEGSDSDGPDDFDSDDYSNMVEDDSDVDSNAESGDDDSNDESGDDDSNDESGDDDSNDESGDEGESDDFEITGSDDDESDNESGDEEVIPPKKGKGFTAPPPVVQKKGKITVLVPVHKKQVPEKKTKPQLNNKAQQQGKVINDKAQQKGKVVDQKHPKVEHNKKEPQQKGPKTAELGKRKAPQKIAVSPKKSKFEKQTQQPMKKQFKKK